MRVSESDIILSCLMTIMLARQGKVVKCTLVDGILAGQLDKFRVA